MSDGAPEAAASRRASDSAQSQRETARGRSDSAQGRSDSSQGRNDSSQGRSEGAQGAQGQGTGSQHDDGAGLLVDARGLLCPAPVIALAKAARTLDEGTRVTVLATDPAAAVDIPAWARMRGHHLVDTARETTKDGEHLVLTVLLGPAKPR